MKKKNVSVRGREGVGKGCVEGEAEERRRSGRGREGGGTARRLPVMG